MAAASDSSHTSADFFAEFGRLVYVPDANDGYKLGKLVDFHTDGLSVELLDEKRVVCVPHDDVLPAEDETNKDVDDSCSLMYLNEGTLLNNCRQRYARKEIYTYVANILISINPYETIQGLYSKETIANYQGKSLGALPPHIFAIADKAHRDLKRSKQSQSIIVSGESGAGKTESQKYILRYLCDRWGASAGPIEQRLLDANPILEAFGNAKTMRNNNSSRFGKFVEIHFGKEYSVVGGFVSHYLLEKSRLCHQSVGERNYHVFYQLLAGADEQLAEKLKLGPPNAFRYLKSGNSDYFATSASFTQIPSNRRNNSTFLQDELIDDFSDFKTLQSALLDIGFDSKTMFELFSTLAGILHLGNVEFMVSEATHGGCVVSSDSEAGLETAAELLGLDVDELTRQLTSRVMSSRAGIKGTVIMVPLKINEANAARDALAKSIYSRLFDSIVAAVNRCIPFADSVGYIGVLDIAGFEFFQVNSFEQFCINYCNEKLQQFFNERILKHEQELYRREALNVPDIEFVDNQDCIDLFEAKTNGLLDLLDEEARLPRASAVHFTEEVHRIHAQHFRLTQPRRSRLREHRDLRDSEGFLIRHYAGAVCYQTAHFLEKNNDALHTSLEMIVEMSANEFLKQLFVKPTTTPDQRPSTPSRSGSTKLTSASVGSKFRSQLSLLLEKLNSTGTHFVRCIKPNSEMLPEKFEGAQILSQLKCAGMGSVLRLMHCGFPSRTSFSDLYTTYQAMLPERLKRLDPRLFCKCLFHALGLAEADFQFGLTKAFFRAGKFAEFDQLMHQDEKHMTLLVSKVQSWLNKTRWKKLQWAIISCIRVNEIIVERKKKYAKAQAIIRGHLIRKKVLPQLAAFKQLVSLSHRFSEVQNLVKSIENSEIHAEMETKVDDLVETTGNLKKSIKESVLKSDPKISKVVEELQKQLANLVENLRAQIAVEEEAKLEAIEVETRRQKELAEEAEREKVEQEAKLAEIREMEILRQREQAEEARLAAEQEIQLRDEEEKMEEEWRQRKIDQLDGEIALRLAHENRGNAVDSTPQKKDRNVSESSQVQNELAKYSHAQLRSILNTTNDEVLLKACQAEFHRRLRFFNCWRFKNQKVQNSSNIPVSKGRNPGLKLPPSLLSKIPVERELFFRTPLLNRKRNAPGASPESGFWFAHFIGERIVREIIFKPKMPPQLLLAGKDDAHMTRRPLSETGLCHTNCSIQQHEFEAAWLRFKGNPFWRAQIKQMN